MSKARFFVCDCGDDLKLSHWDSDYAEICVLTYYCKCGREKRFRIREISATPNKANPPTPKCLLCNDTGQHLVDCPLCDKSGGLS